MEELKKVLEGRPVLYLAAMGKHKEAYKQLLDNTNLELTAALGSDEWVRIRGTVNFDTSAEAYAAAFAEMPDLKESFSEDTGKRLALIYLDHISAMVFDREDNAQLLAKF